jgi:hypothetical protein
MMSPPPRKTAGADVQQVMLRRLDREERGRIEVALENDAFSAVGSNGSWRRSH